MRAIFSGVDGHQGQLDCTGDCRHLVTYNGRTNYQNLGSRVVVPAEMGPPLRRLFRAWGVHAKQGSSCVSTIAVKDSFN